MIFNNVRKKTPPKKCPPAPEKRVPRRGVGATGKPPRMGVRQSFQSNQSGERPQHYSLFFILYSFSVSVSGVWGRPESSRKRACAYLSNQTKALSVNNIIHYYLFFIHYSLYTLSPIPKKCTPAPWQPLACAAGCECVSLRSPQCSPGCQGKCFQVSSAWPLPAPASA